MTDLLTLDGWGQRAESFRFDLLDRYHNRLGDLTAEADQASISNNINRSVKRQLSGLVLPPSVTRDVNTLTDRVMPWMRLQDGTEYPLGVFMFADASRRLRTSSGVDLALLGDDNYVTEGSCLDLGAAVDQPTRGVTFAAPGDNVRTLLVQQLEAAGITDYQVDNTDVTISDWLVWKSDVSRLKVINDLAAMAGFYSLYFDNLGVAILRKVPSMDAVEPTLVYGPGGSVWLDSIVESDDLLSAPNVYLVVNSGFTAGPIWGEWQVPASAPHSYANRGRWVTSKHDVQGVDSNGQARAIAKSIGQADYHTYRWVNFTSAIDPRHDTFDVIGWKGEKYREQGWTLDMASGGAHDHELRRVWSDDVADEILEAA